MGKTTPFWVQSGEEAYQNNHLRNLSVADFFRKYGKATDDEIACWFAYSGYNLYHSDVQASIFVDDGELYDSSRGTHSFVHEGFMQVVNKLLDASKVNAELGAYVTEIRQSDKDQKVVVNTNRGRILARKVILAIPAEAVANIKGLENLI